MANRGSMNDPEIWGIIFVTLEKDISENYLLYVTINTYATPRTEASMKKLVRKAEFLLQIQIDNRQTHWTLI